MRLGSVCESPHSHFTWRGIKCEPHSTPDRRPEDTVINKDKQAFDEQVVLSRDSFDPELASRNGHDDDNVLPYLTLEVDGLTSRRDEREGQSRLRPDDVAVADEPAPDTSIPTSSSGADGLEVYGWESSLWHKIRGYLGF